MWMLDVIILGAYTFTYSRLYFAFLLLIGILLCIWMYFDYFFIFLNVSGLVQYQTN